MTMIWINQPGRALNFQPGMALNKLLWSPSFGNKLLWSPSFGIIGMGYMVPFYSFIFLC
uniref:Uncharacterized protein n=1 Tax=Picea sitchensis TaxID=3332 RepID=A0A6B9XU40_PICSI|nr:hypothetical protein Q903MT_gene5653 [Picea sitchensis]